MNEQEFRPSVFSGFQKLSCWLRRGTCRTVERQTNALIDAVQFSHADVMTAFRITGALWVKSTNHGWIPLTKS